MGSSRGSRVYKVHWTPHFCRPFEFWAQIFAQIFNVKMPSKPLNKGRVNIFIAFLIYLSLILTKAIKKGKTPLKKGEKGPIFAQTSQGPEFLPTPPTQVTCIFFTCVKIILRFFNPILFGGTSLNKFLDKLIPRVMCAYYSRVDLSLRFSELLCASLTLVSLFPSSVYVKHACPDSKRTRLDSWLQAGA